MESLQPIDILRASRWKTIPTDPGVYWWYFPTTSLLDLHVDRYCRADRLNLLREEPDMVCLYHGIATNLSQRIAWHAEQRLDSGAIRSGFLSTFRFSLLSLLDVDYFGGDAEINRFFDTLCVRWEVCSSKAEAEAIEARNLSSGMDFPLNISGNHSPGTRDYVRFLKAQRKAYKAKVLQSIE